MIADMLDEYQEKGVVYIEIAKGCDDMYHPGLILDRGTDYESMISESIAHDTSDAAALYIIKNITPTGTVRLVLPEGKDSLDESEFLGMIERGDPIMMEIKVAAN